MKAIQAIASSIRSILSADGTAGRTCALSHPYASNAVRTISIEELRIRVDHPVPGSARRVAPASSNL
jgi:hypothetical protein